MKCSLRFAVALATMVFAQQAAAQAPDPIATLLVQDIRLAAIAERMLQASDVMCRRHMPLAGLLIHSRDQYRADPGAAFANGPVAVSGVLPGSVAATAGLHPGDGIVTVGSQAVSAMRAEGAAPLRDTVFGVFADAPADRPLELTIARGGGHFTISLGARSGCRALVEIRSAGALQARSDGRVIQVDYGLAAAASDQELAVIFAHELGHLVLEHRRRLEAAGVSKGFFGEFGKNQRLNRQVEVEADRMSVHLLANAGFDPRLAPSFWRSALGRRAGGGLMRSATYPSPESRAQLLEREIADYLGAGVAPTWPGHLLSRRDTPF